ncbi:hypothetical protein [Aeromonas veronii]|uniref:hypothetical protein n=1 Tax=Aeromonas veronii TaxID=654 RepID=UPI003DA5FA51
MALPQDNIIACSLFFSMKDIELSNDGPLATTKIGTLLCFNEMRAFFLKKGTERSIFLMV